VSAVQSLPPETSGTDLAPEALRIAYVVPMFPCWSDTWIVREIRAHLGRGVEVTILSLRHPTEPFAHADAQAMADRVVYARKGWRAVLAVARCVARAPRASLGTLVEAVRDLWRRPKALAKTVVGWWRTLSVAETIAERRPALVHAHFASYPSTSAMILSRLMGVPFSFTCHAHDVFVESHLLREKLSRAAVAVTISEFNRSFIAGRLGPWAGQRLSVIHCGVKLDEFEYRAGPRDPATIVGVARLDEVKGFRVLVEACRILRDRGRTFRCEIIGEGSLRRALDAQVHKAGLEGLVSLPGAMPQDEVRARLRRAAVFAMPSVVAADGNRDGIPVALMEAMAVGTPVVSTTVSGIPELVRSGWSGLLCEPGDAAALAAHFETLFDDPERGACLAANARATIEEQFDSEREAEKLLDALRAAAVRN
jgi:colanic acid/amylovoran biosynthesis glycosyltransferase